MKGSQSGIGGGGAGVASSVMIKNKLLLMALIATSILLPAAVGAREIQIQVGDRPFYNHGAHYWNGDYQMIWIPGHMSNFGHHWIHGHYVRGEHRQHGLNHHHDYQHDHQGEYHDDYRR